MQLCSTWMRVFISRKKYSPSWRRPLDRPGRAVADGARGVDGDPADPLAELASTAGEGVSSTFLVAALDRAIALAEVDHVAVRIGEDRHLDVSRIVQVALDVDGRIEEVRLALALGRLERTRGLVRAGDDLQPLPPPPAEALMASGQPSSDPSRTRSSGRGERLGRPRNDRDARGTHPPARGDLGAHRLDRLGRRPDRMSPASPTARAKPAFSARNP